MAHAVDILLGAMMQHGHIPRITHQTEGYIRADCQRCGCSGSVSADSAGEYIEDSARGTGFAVECPERGQPPS
jgi:hypothetical protein